MKQVPDRKKLRREYVRKKRKAIGIAYGRLASGFAGFVAILLLYPTLNNYDESLGSWLFLCLLIVFGISICLVTVGTHRAVDNIGKIPYVPPVTPDTLPADEILVRGSEEPPVAQSEVLLRAARGIETPKEELLRVNQE